MDVNALFITDTCYYSQLIIDFETTDVII